MPITWGCCEEKIEGNHATCYHCKQGFHLVCLQSIHTQSEITELLSTKWICPSCKSARPKAGQKTIANPSVQSSGSSENLNVRSKKRQALSSPPIAKTSSAALDDIRDVVAETLKAERAKIIEEVRETISSLISAELRTIKDDIQGVKDSMAFIGNDYDDKRELKLSAEMVKNLETQNENLKSCITNLTSRINQMEQHTRGSNIELQCVPEYKMENLISMTKQLGSVIGCKVADDQILNCTRVAKQNRDSDRPRSIVIQFYSPRARDLYLAAAIDYNKKHGDDRLNSSHIGMAGEKKPIFVCEHLSPTNKAIHAAARVKAKELGYKFVWVRGGRILMRKDATSVPKVIKHIDCLERLE